MVGDAYLAKTSFTVFITVLLFTAIVNLADKIFLFCFGRTKNSSVITAYFHSKAFCPN
jgi:hypothetical protein